MLPSPPRRILVICTRRLGDVLLTTALLRSLRQAWPDAELDVITLQWSAAALAGNPDVTRVIALPEAAGLIESFRALGRPRRYDLALSTLYSDRPHLMAFWAAPKRVGIVPKNPRRSWWKRRLATRTVDYRPKATHAVVQYLLLADALGIPRHPDLVPPRPPSPPSLPFPPRTYAVLHAPPMYVYKRWPRDHWSQLARWLLDRGLKVVLSGGPAAADRAYVADVLRNVPGGTEGVVDVAGRFSFAELTPLIENAAVFVGPDTSVTHLAAATGTPTIALFGPSAPVSWGPWPAGLDGTGDSPWTMVAPLQHAGNVWIVQGIAHCVPCLGEGCDKHPASRADCLDQMPVSRVTAVVERILSGSARPP